SIPAPPRPPLLPYTTLFRSSGTIRTSTNGVSWTSRTSGTTQVLYGVAYGGGGILPGFNPGDPIAWAIRHDATGMRMSLKIGTTRSEEHTSELQSRENLVCRP